MNLFVSLRSLFGWKKKEGQTPQTDVAVKQVNQKQKEQAMQPTTPTTQEPEKAEEKAPATVAATTTPAPAPTPAAEEPKKVAAEGKTLEITQEPAKEAGPIRPENRPHAFVVMPFGKKKGGDGSI